jgi:hypothetical protein
MSQNPRKPDLVPIERPQRPDWAEAFHRDIEQASIGPRYFSNPRSNVTYRLRCTEKGLLEFSFQKTGGAKAWTVILLMDADDVVAAAHNRAGR